jgi:hypothetical protein
MTVQAAGAHRAAWMVVLVRGPGATLLVRPHWIVWTIAVLVAASAATVVYRYTSVDVGRLRPLPDMHGPTWALPGKRVRPGRDRAGKSVCAAQVHSGSRTSWSAQNKETKMIAAISQSLKCRRRRRAPLTTPWQRPPSSILPPRPRKSSRSMRPTTPSALRPSPG